MADATNAAEGATRPAETKSERFRRLMKERMGKVVERIDGLKRLFNAKEYEFNQEQVNKVADQFQAWADELRATGTSALAAPAAAAKPAKPSFDI